MEDHKQLISVVIPCCNEEANVPRLHQALVGVFAPLAPRTGALMWTSRSTSSPSHISPSA